MQGPSDSSRVSSTCAAASKALPSASSKPHSVLPEPSTISRATSQPIAQIDAPMIDEDPNDDDEMPPHPRVIH